MKKKNLYRLFFLNTKNDKITQIKMKRNLNKKIIQDINKNYNNISNTDHLIYSTKLILQKLDSVEFLHISFFYNIKIMITVMQEHNLKSL